MKKIITLAFAVVLMINSAYAFKEYGHQTIVALAKMHLTDKAKSEVETLLTGDMVKFSHRLPALRKSANMPHLREWEYFTLDANGKSTTTNENDGVVALEKAIEVLRNRKSESDSLVVASLYTVIQLVGDMHCISNVRIEGLVENDRFPFKVAKKENMLPEKMEKYDWRLFWHRYTNRHDVFSPQYYAQDIEIYLGKKRAEYEKGTPRFWVENVGEDAVHCLEKITADAVIPTELVNRYEDIHNKCMAKAGYRLSALLNDIFK